MLFFFVELLNYFQNLTGHPRTYIPGPFQSHPWVQGTNDFHWRSCQKATWSCWHWIKEWETSIHLKKRKNPLRITDWSSDRPRYCAYQPRRRLPVILPHELVPWLVRNGLWPNISHEDLEAYWKNMERWSGTTAPCDPKRCAPLFIWGDDCVFNESNEKLIVIVIGHALDPRTFSIEVCWPVFVLREVTCNTAVYNFLVLAF